MAIELFRIDDRLIHGQVVVGWGQPMDLTFIVLVDDEVASSEWEQELYRMGVPPEMDVYFHTVEEAAEKLPSYQRDEGIAAARDLADGRHEPGGEIAVPGDERARVRLGLTHRLPPGTA